MRVNLCDSGCCPEVVTLKDGVKIGEGENKVKLKTGEWNSLVEKIKKGDLRKF